MVHHIDAVYDESEGMLYPPRQSLGFNPQLKLNDSLLAYSYAEAYDISFPEAMQRLMADVEQLVAEIKDKGYYEIDDIGVMRLNAEGAYEFEPFDAGVLTPSLYGLSSFAIEPVVAKSDARQSEEPAKTEAVEVQTREESSTSDTSGGSDESEYIRIPRRWVRYAAVACIAFLIVMIIPLPTNTMMQTFRAGQMDSSLLYRILPQISTKMPTFELKGMDEKPKAAAKKQEPSPCTKAKTPETKQQPSPVEAKEQPKTVVPCFSIVLASKVGKANAENFVATIAKKGYAEGRVAKMSQGYRVFYGRYASMSEANAAKSKLSSNDLFADCWIMETADAEAK